MSPEAENSSPPPKVETLDAQLQMVQEWETQPGEQRWGSAYLILEDREEPMTQHDFLQAEGLGGMDLDEVLDDLEQEIEQGTLPPWFDRLPRGETPGMW